MPPPVRSELRWIDQHWDAIVEVLPTLTMDWLYREHGEDRLKHHIWMLKRPTFLATAWDIRCTLAEVGDAMLRSVAKTSRFDFPGGMQRTIALRFVRHLQDTDGAEVAVFLVATSCELLGIRPYCAYQEAAYKEWVMQACTEKVAKYGNVYNMLNDIIAQTSLWVLGCLPYSLLKQVVTSTNDIVFSDDPFDTENQRLLILRRYTLHLNSQLQRISAHKGGPPRTYHESEVH